MTLDHNPAALSEFIAGYHGDCGETAELAALHALSPVFALTAVSLGTIVKREIAQGAASSNGSEPLAAILSDLEALGCQAINYGYAEPFPHDVPSILAAHGGVHPVILELANAQALPGDERGVAYHFITQLDRGQFADGDNPACASGSLVSYTDSDLVAARVCGVVVVTAVPSSDPGWGQSVSYTQQSDGWFKCDQTGNRVGGGLMAAINAQGWGSLPCAHGEEDYGGNFSAAIVGSNGPNTGCHVVVWDANKDANGNEHGALIGYDAAYALAIANQLDTAQAVIKSLSDQHEAQAEEITSLQQKLAQAQQAAQAAPAPATPAPTAAPSLDSVAIQALAAALASVKAGS